MSALQELRKRAAELSKDGWTVGRTDLRSWDHNGMPEHYAYPPTGTERVKFNGIDHADALRKALRHAELKNDQLKEAGMSPQARSDRKFIKLCDKIVTGESLQHAEKQNTKRKEAP